MQGVPSRTWPPAPVGTGLYDSLYAIDYGLVFFWDGGVPTASLDDFDDDADEPRGNSLWIRTGPEGLSVVRICLIAIASDETLPSTLAVPVHRPSSAVLHVTDGLFAMGTPANQIRTPEGIFDTDVTVLRLNTGTERLPLRLWHNESTRTLYVGVPESVRIVEVVQSQPIPPRDTAVDLDGRALPRNAVPIDEYLSQKRSHPVASLVVQSADGRRQQVDPFLEAWRRKLAEHEGEDSELGRAAWEVTHIVVGAVGRASRPPR